MIDGSKITADDIVENQRYLKGFLLSKVPEADLSDGSFFNDVVIRSMAYVLALFEKESTNIKSRMHVDNVALSEDTTASQILDNIASNFFVTRNNGTFSNGTVRVEISSNSASVLIQPQTRFVKSSGVNFMYAGGADESTPLFIPIDSLKETLGTDGSPTGTFFFDVPVVGETEFIGSELAPGFFESASPSIPNLVSIRNIDPFTLADSLESNYEFAQRIKESITHRGFSSSKGMRAHLLDTIDSLSKVTVVGATSSLMRRDMLEIDGIESTFKTLGKCNVYYHSSASIVERTLSFPADSVPTALSSGLVSLPIGRESLTNLLNIDDFGYSRIDKIYDSQGNLVLILKDNTAVDSTDSDYADSNHLEIKYNDIDSTSAPNTSGYLFSRTNLESMSILVPHPGQGAGVSLIVSAVVPDSVAPVENEIYSTDNSVPNLDILAYSSTCKRVYLNISYFRNPDYVGDIPEAALAADIADYVNSLNSSNDELELPELVSHILSEFSFIVSGIDLSETSIEMSMLLPNGVTVVHSVASSTSLNSSSTRPYYNLPTSTGTIKRWNYLPDNYLANLQVDDSTCALICFPKDITLVESTR